VTGRGWRWVPLAAVSRQAVSSLTLKALRLAADAGDARGPRPAGSTQEIEDSL
jgi:hypothetical protein